MVRKTIVEYVCMMPDAFQTALKIDKSINHDFDVYSGSSWIYLTNYESSSSGYGGPGISYCNLVYYFVIEIGIDPIEYK